MEVSSLSIRRTLTEIGLPHSTFSAWYKRSLEGGPEALEYRKPRCRSVWNRIPERIRAQVIETANGARTLRDRVSTVYATARNETTGCNASHSRPPR